MDCPPDPLEYLQGFDAVPETQTYKETLLQACHVQVGDHVLDVGCGTATLAPRVSDAVGSSGQVIGIDASSEMIQHAATQHASLDNVLFQTASVYRLPSTVSIQYV